MILVHVAIAIHLAHWWTAGETLSPVEPSESMETLRTGVINAGFVFFALMIASTLVVGRFFCGWACHMVALQDLCGWMLKRVGVRPKVFRTRTLIAVPFLVSFYMFAYPSLYAWINGWVESWAPTFHAAWGQAPTITEWQLHLTKVDFWETFPGPVIGIVTILVASFGVVYFLGAKGFCTYGCPYGAVFAVSDRFSPGKIVANLDACHQCGHCTATCTSNVAVHKEIQVYGKVVDRGCMKCLDCVSVCPNGALSFGFTKPQVITKKREGKKAPQKRYDVSAFGELALWVTALLLFFSMRGAYGFFPLLLALGLAAIFTFVFWKAWHLLRARHVTFHGTPLKTGGRLRRKGVLWIGVSVVALAVTVHTYWIQFEHFRARDLSREIGLEVSLGTPEEELAELVSRTRRHYESVRGFWRGGFGLLHNPQVDLELAWLALRSGDRAAATAALDAAEPAVRGREGEILQLARLHGRLGNLQNAEMILRDAWRKNPTYLQVLAELRTLLVSSRRVPAARVLYEEHLAEHPDDFATRLDYAMQVLTQQQISDPTKLEAAQAELKAELVRAEQDLVAEIERHPTRTHLRASLANLIHVRQNRYDEAKEQFQLALEVRPDAPDLHNDYAVSLILAGEPDAAIVELEKYAELAPRNPEPAERLAQLHEQLGKSEGAERWRAEAVERREASRALWNGSRGMRWAQWFVDRQ